MSASFQYPFDFAMREELLFSNFVTDARNDVLLHYLQNFVTGPDRLCYLFGEKGSGKTHLLQALCQHDGHAVYLPLTQLQPYGPAVLEGLESLELLVLDDLQQVAGRQDWELQLFRLFNAVQTSGGRICFAADCPLPALPVGLPDLRSRLQLCVQFEVLPPDDAGKALVLRQAATQRGMEVREEVAHYILQRSSRNMHDLMAVLDRLDKLSLAEQRRITVPFVKACMQW